MSHTVNIHILGIIRKRLSSSSLYITKTEVQEVTERGECSPILSFKNGSETVCREQNEDDGGRITMWRFSVTRSHLRLMNNKSFIPVESFKV